MQQFNEGDRVRLNEHGEAVTNSALSGLVGTVTKVTPMPEEVRVIATEVAGVGGLEQGEAKFVYVDFGVPAPKPSSEGSTVWVLDNARLELAFVPAEVA
jgi:hypothetical protein